MERPVRLSAAERVLVHLHGFVRAVEADQGMTQAGIADGARVQRSHVPRTVKALLEEGLLEEREARLPGRTRRARVYSLTPAGVEHVRTILRRIETTPVEIEGRSTSLGEARQLLGLSVLEAAAAVDDAGRLRGVAPPSDAGELLQRDADLAFLRRWRAGPAPLAVVYGSKGIGKTALGRTFARTVDGTVWIDLKAVRDLRDFAERVEEGAPRAIADSDPGLVAEALLAPFDAGVRLVVLDSYGEVPEVVVDTLAILLGEASRRDGVKLLVLAQETTPAYCRFYARKDVVAGLVAEHHLRGLDLEGCRRILGRPDIPEEDLRRIYLLTKGCPLYLQFIREGDEYGLKENSRFTKAEVQLLLYSGRGDR